MRTVVSSIRITLHLHLWSLVIDCGFVLMTAFEQQHCKLRQCWIEIHFYYAVVQRCADALISRPRPSVSVSLRLRPQNSVHRRLPSYIVGGYSHKTHLSLLVSLFYLINYYLPLIRPTINYCLIF